MRSPVTNARADSTTRMSWSDASASARYGTASRAPSSIARRATALARSAPSSKKRMRASAAACHATIVGLFGSSSSTRSNIFTERSSSFR